MEYTVLSACLSAGPISINDLRKLLPIDPGHMTRTTNRLEDKDLIEKARSSADRRLVVVTMTDAGAALTPELTTARARVLWSSRAGHQPGGTGRLHGE